ncbi:MULTISPECIES: EAL domain-containing protein [Gammaproteobacteria]|uniref:EAL domain-containing protein n=1 Tax=Gammaproteobacteria TaxID=1236 RepID=UPI000DCFC200|nr:MULTISPECIES: EAL domain-containing protein [Gammaproteobacteria]RTE86234.1 EAL domain-containing protein [Aliidiomarina sp. B3213]TCZ91585.1 EAL domain-containing protein [Lysobacter sp. N42]
MAVCNTCQCYKKLGFDIKMAFQPIVNVREQTLYAHEALVRGANGEGAGEVIGKVTDEMIYSFDQQCRMTAIETASKVKLPSRVSINFLPNAIYEPETCLARTLETANRVKFPRENIIFEVTEHEKIENKALLKEVFKTYKEHGFLTAIDDFGEGYAGLNMLSDFQPDLLKIDMNLIRNIDTDKVKRSIVKGVLTVANDLDITPIAEGIETEGEKNALIDLGIELMQGFYFAKPHIEAAHIPTGFRAA